VASQAQSQQLGYETALALGATALENGFSAAAVPYLERATALRPSRYGLVQLAKAQRDQGQLQAARATLIAARQLPDGEDTYVLVTLAAIHCDLGENGSAFEVACDAVKISPQDPAALSVMARAMKELTGSLAKHDHLDPGAIEQARLEAAKMAERARAVRPDSEPDIRELRRQRAGIHWTPPAPDDGTGWAPVQQDPGQALVKSTMSETTLIDVGSVPEESLLEGQSKRPWWRRALAALHLGS
jgi:tetratricopeptide (TPR) repeat protein